MNHENKLSKTEILDLEKGDVVTMRINPYSSEKYPSEITGEVEEAIPDYCKDLVADYGRLSAIMANLSVRDGETGDLFTFNTDNGYVIGPRPVGRSDIGRFRGIYKPE